MTLRVLAVGENLSLSSTRTPLTSLCCWTRLMSDFSHALNASFTKEPLAALPVFSLGLCGGTGPHRSSCGDRVSVHGAEWPSKFRTALMSSVVWPRFVKVRLILEHLNSLFLPSELFFLLLQAAGKHGNCRPIDGESVSFPGVFHYELVVFF